MSALVAPALAGLSAALVLRANGAWPVSSTAWSVAGAEWSVSSTVEIEHPLFPEAQWRAVAQDQLSFFGQIPWSGHLSWWSP